MASSSSTSSSTETRSTTSAWRRHGHYEYRVLTIDRRTSVPDARRMLTEEAEYGRWELARTRIYVGGERKVWLRRKVIKVTPTL